MRESKLSRALLAWYDQHARDLPWRILPAARAAGQRADPYAVWLSEVMLQQTTVAAVRPYYSRFLQLWPEVADLAAAQDSAVMAEWAGLGYYARARNLLRCARVITAEHGGTFPDTLEGLRALPGIGPYTAAAIASIAFDRKAVVVDGNVERVMARLFAVQVPLPDAKPLLTEHAARLTPTTRAGDYAQAVMDLGATICTPRTPDCAICPLNEMCAARDQGIAESLPKKRPKVAKPTRQGHAFLAQRGDQWLLEQRPDKGLLGGMLGWPGPDWQVEPHEAAPPFTADWRKIGNVRHTFTHFHLDLTVWHAQAPDGANPPSGSFQPVRRSDLPTVMRKAYDLAVLRQSGD